MRATHHTVHFPHPVTLSGSPQELPAGQYELLIEQETITARGFPAFRWTAAYLTMPGTQGGDGRRKRRPLNGADLANAMRHCRPFSTKNSEAALSPQEDRT